MPWGQGAAVGDEINNLYWADAAVNPQKAYDSIVSDYGLSCSSIILSRTAKSNGGRYSAPIYIFVNDWSLQYPHQTNPGYISRFAWHSLDLVMLTESWSSISDGSYSPGPQDLAGSAFLQSVWYNFISSGSPGHDWLAVDAAPGWPQHYNTFQYIPQSSSVVVDFKSDICTYFDTIGLDNQTFWWCD